MSERQLTIIFWLTINIIILHQTSEAKPDWIDGLKMKNVITNIIEKSVGETEFQEYIYNKDLIESPLDGQLLLNQFTATTRRHLESAFTAIENMKSVLEEDYRKNRFKQGSAKTDTTQCCLIDDDKLPWSTSFMRKIGTAAMCTRYSEDATEDYFMPFTERLLTVMKGNRYNNKEIKWQYFGSNQGIFVIYPQHKVEDCDEYDPRHRPWYAEVADSNPKDIVVVFDRSGSIDKRELLSIILKSSDLLIQTLNANDRIAMVAFDEDVYRPPGNKIMSCYYNKLAFATPDNKDYLIKWLNNIKGGSTSNYMRGLSAAFDYFQNSGDVKGDPRSRRRVILFLGDGRQDYGSADGGRILELISNRNAQLNNSVMIITYGIGTDLSPEAEDLMKNMALQTEADLNVGPIKRGEFVQIESSANLRVKLGSYYNIISDVPNGKPVITTPYVDFDGLGLIISICLPVRHNDQLQGITCLDISLGEILKEVIHLHHGHYSYAFISDYKGQTVSHPLMPDALNYGAVIYLDISQIERDAGVEDIIDDMKRSNSGRKSLMKNFVKPRGNTTTDGVRSQRIDSIYFWNQIQNGSFSMAVVIADLDRNVTVSNESLASENFIYYRLDLVDNVDICSSHGRLSTREHSVVKLTEGAFVKSYFYKSPETKEMVGIYTSYLENKQVRNHDRLKLITKQMIAISEHLEKIWMNRKDLDDYVIWRYYGDYYGHIRIYPGLTLPREYDHTNRGFFWKAVNNRELITVTPPYIDAFGAGVVSSVVVPIFARRNRATLLGVLGLDIKTNYVRYLVEEAFPACVDESNSCFIMDNSGYLVHHSQIEYGTRDNTTELYNYHITELEASISRYLISKGHLTRGDCIDFGYKKKLYTWKVSLENSLTSYDSSPYFDMVRVFGTNLFLGIKNKNRETPISDCSCPNRNATDFGKKFYQCSKNQCTCPCAVQADYDYCQNQFQLDKDGPLACVPQPHSIGFKSPITDEEQLIKRLPECYHYKCAAKRTKRTCLLLEPCSWCPDTSECVDDSCPPKSGSSTSLIVGTVLGGIVLLVAIIVTIIALVVRKQRGTTPRPGDYIPHDMELTLPTSSREKSINAIPDVVEDRYNAPMEMSLGDTL